MRPQSQIDDLLQQLIGQYAGQRVDYYGFAGECLSLGKRWFDVVSNGHLNGPMMAPPAAAWGSDWWAIPPEAISSLFDKVAYDPNASYPAGSIGVNTATHHVFILINNNPGHPTATVFEQNADPDGSAAHSAQRLKSMIDGVLVIKAATPALPDPYTAHWYAAPVDKVIKVNTHRYDLKSYRDITAMAQNPVGPAYAGDRFSAAGIADHVDGHQYYFTADASTTGWEVNDCTDYVAPAPVYTPPAAPVNVPKITYYDLVTTVMWFRSSQNANDRYNAQGTLDKAQYIELKRDGNAVQVVRNNTDKTTYWINDKDNVLLQAEAATAPVVATVMESPTVNVVAPVVEVTVPVDTGVLPTVTHPKPQYLPIREDRQPIRLTSTNTVPVPMKDLEEKWLKYGKYNLPPKQTAEYTMYTIIGGKEYWIPDEYREKGYYFGVDVTFLPEEPQPTLFDHNANGRADIIDIFDNGIQGFADFSNKYFTGLKQAVSKPAIIQAKQRITRAVDGFSKRK